MANIDSMDDIQNLFKETIAEFMENGLEAELDEELGLYPSGLYTKFGKAPVCLSGLRCKLMSVP